MAAKKSTKKAEGIQVTLVPSEDILPSRIYSNYIKIGQTPFDFSLKFCDATPITVTATTEVVDGKMSHPIPIVAEIAIPFGLMPKFIKALQTQHKMYKNRIEGEKNAGKSPKK